MAVDNFGAAFIGPSVLVPGEAKVKLAEILHGQLDNGAPIKHPVYPLGDIGKAAAALYQRVRDDG
ncbi:hypothetical protein SDC9_208013 [bioreactor metagenome]|uniref:Uncharacterized protein n=1 Tax=bioreactor metagenome TaxID=1076179 RepID=A0A645JA35_9ZZZZ